MLQKGCATCISTNPSLTHLCAPKKSFLWPSQRGRHFSISQFQIRPCSKASLFDQDPEQGTAFGSHPFPNCPGYFVYNSTFWSTPRLRHEGLPPSKAYFQKVFRSCGERQWKRVLWSKLSLRGIAGLFFSCLLFCPACPNFSAHMGTFGLVSNLEASQLNFHTDQETKLPMFYVFDSVGWLAFKTRHSLLRCWDTTFEPSQRPTPCIKCWRCLGARAKNLVRSRESITAFLALKALLSWLHCWPAGSVIFARIWIRQWRSFLVFKEPTSRNASKAMREVAIVILTNHWISHKSVGW